MKITAWSVSVLTALLLSACSGSSNEPTPTTPTARDTPRAKLALKSFQTNCDDLLDYAADGLTEEYLQQFFCFADGPCPAFMESPQAGADGGTGGNGGSGSGGGPTRVSTTNVQEAGVDEADIVKVDGTGHLYILSGSRLSILQAFPPAGLDERPLATLDLAANDAGFYADDLFLDETGKRVVVLGSSTAAAGSFATSVLIDVSNPAAPQETGRLGTQGYGLESRRIGARVHRVSRYDVPRPEWLYAPNDPLQQKRSDYLAARRENRESTAATIKSQIRTEIGKRVAAGGSTALLPKTFSVSAGVRTENTLGCASLARPDVTTGLGMALVDSFNIDGSARATTGVINNAYLVYASASNLYLAQSSSGWFFAPDQSEETVVYRLALSNTGAAQYRGLGKVPGSVKDAYSFSEHEGYLRVASTESSFGANDAVSSRNGLRILDVRANGDMEVVGSVGDLAPGERIQGVRLLGDRGFIVTFRRIDPLFALDLRDPAHPVVASELKIPGFSSYLMPIGEDYLLTIGRAGTDDGLSGKVAVQLFDVRDLSAVKQVAVLTPNAGSNSYQYSSAEYDPHAFSYFADSTAAASPGTLTVPLHSYGNSPQSSFAGFLVIRVAPGSETPLSEIGRVDHEQFLATQDFCSGPAGGDYLCAPDYSRVEPRRAVYMQNGADTFLYTISTAGVLASPALQPSTRLGGRPLPYDPPCYYFYGCAGIVF